MVAGLLFMAGMRRSEVSAHAEDALEEFCRQVPGAVRNKSRTYAIELTFGKNDWAALEQPLDKFLAAVVESWKRNSSHPSDT